MRLLSPTGAISEWSWANTPGQDRTAAGSGKIAASPSMS